MISDDGNRLVIDSQPWLIGKIFGVVFAVLAVVMPLILVLSLVLPPNRASFDCDRARNTCILQHAAWKKEVPIGDIAAASLKHRGSTRNSSASDWVEVTLKNGQDLRTSESVYHRALTDAMAAAVSGLNQFLAGDQPAFHAEYQSSDNDWWTMIPMAIICPFVFWLMLRLWVSRNIEIDRAARTLRLRMKRKLHPPTDETFAFEEITGFVFAGINWGSLAVLTKRGSRLMLVWPWSGPTRERMRELSQKLTEIAPFDATDAIKKRWDL